MFVIVNDDTGKYVTFMGKHSYTKDIKLARRFNDRDKAKSECCGNEFVVKLESQLTPPG